MTGCPGQERIWVAVARPEAAWLVFTAAAGFSTWAWAWGCPAHGTSCHPTLRTFRLSSLPTYIVYSTPTPLTTADFVEELQPIALLFQIAFSDQE